jgi:hypothetical protein
MEEKVYKLVEKLYVEFTKRFDEIEEKLDMKADKTDIVLLENKNGTKLDILIDSHKAITETLEDHTNRLQRIEDKIETHDIQIHVLDKTKVDKRKVK